MNRGIARRTVFETRGGMRFFLAQIARAVRRGEIVVHAFCVMTTHFHLLVESPREKLSVAMQRAENAYVRWFNRRARRDGPLFRGRYKSKSVDSITYRRTLVRYLDHNPVTAGTVALPEAYEFGSARAYVADKAPPWLETEWVLGDLRSEVPRSVPSAEAYRSFYGTCDPDTRFLAEHFIEREGPEATLDDVLVLPRDGLVSWVQKRAQRADQCAPDLPILGPHRLTEALGSLSAQRRPASRGRGRPRLSYREAAEVGLLRDFCCLTLDEVAIRLRLSTSTAKGRERAHRRLVANDPDYAEAVAAVAEQALRSFHAGPGPAFYRTFVPGTVRN